MTEAAADSIDDALTTDGEAEGRPNVVWVVVADAGSGDEIWGLFNTEAEAAGYSDEIKGRFTEGTAYTYFEVPYRRVDELTVVEIS